VLWLNTVLFLPGLFSTVMRDLSNLTNDNPKWIMLNGDIDPMWIESLNTVMDDTSLQIDVIYSGMYQCVYFENSSL